MGRETKNATLGDVERLIRMLQRDPSLFQRCKGLRDGDFSVPMFGKVFREWEENWRGDIPLSPGTLSDILSPQEMAHLCGILQNHEGPISEVAFDDCVKIIREAGNKTDDLLAMQVKMKQKKGYGGT